VDQKNFDAFADYLLRGSVLGIVTAITRWTVTLGVIGAAIVLVFQALLYVVFRTPIDLWGPARLVLTMAATGIFGGLVVAGMMRLLVRREPAGDTAGAGKQADEAPALDD
jgi:hypothetical protein